MKKVFEGGFVMWWHMHAGFYFSAFSIKEFFGSKPVNDVKMHLNLNFRPKYDEIGDHVTNLNFSAKKLRAK